MEQSKEQVYDTLIYPLMGKILDICTRHEIGMVSSFHIGDDTPENNDLVVTSALGGGKYKTPPPFIKVTETIGAAPKSDFDIDVNKIFIDYLATQPCENFTHPANCTESNRTPFAELGTESMCLPCMARLAKKQNPVFVAMLANKTKGTR